LVLSLPPLVLVGSPFETNATQTDVTVSKQEGLLPGTTKNFSPKNKPAICKITILLDTYHSIFSESLQSHLQYNNLPTNQPTNHHIGQEESFSPKRYYKDAPPRSYSPFSIMFEPFSFFSLFLTQIKTKLVSWLIVADL
jgi:hypothetical protein